MNYYVFCLEDEKDFSLNIDNVVLRFGCYILELGFEI